MTRKLMGWTVSSTLALTCVAGSALAQGTAPATPAPATADAPKPAYDGPTAKEIIERYIQVTGGRAAYEKITTRETTGTMEIPQQNLKGSTSMMQAAPNKMKMRIDLGGFGSQTSGTDGENAWSVDTMQGARVLTGEEKISLIRQATFNAELNWETLYKDVKAESVQEIDGKPAYAVSMTAEDGQKVTNFYDKESGLLVKSMTVVKGPMGEMPMESTYTNYKEVDGIKMYHTTTISGGMGMTIVMSIDSVKQNAPLPADAFTMPDDVKKTMDATTPAEAPAEEKK